MADVDGKTCNQILKLLLLFLSPSNCREREKLLHCKFCVIAWREWACGEVEKEHSEHRIVEAEWEFEVGGEELGEPTHLSLSHIPIQAESRLQGHYQMV